eukprot:11247723-Karenia_brevis.AAC.1
MQKFFNLVYQRCVKINPKCEGELDCFTWKQDNYQTMHVSIPNTYKTIITATDSHQWMKLQSRAGISHAIRFPETDMDKREAT